MNLINEFDFSYKEVEYYLELITSNISYKASEVRLLKEDATKVIKSLEKITLYNLLKDFDYTFQHVRKLQEFLLREGLKKEIPRVPRVVDKIIETEIKPSEITNKFLSHFKENKV